MDFDPYARLLHTTPIQKTNNVDPDDGNSWLCSACTLPIFASPFKSYQIDNVKFLMHDQCANDPPDELMDNSLHPKQPLTLKQNCQTSITNCDNCHRKCGSKFYECPNNYCRFRLDLLCALQIKIWHRSHHHELMVVRSSSADISCGACGTRHLGSASSSPLSYLCDPCDFWIHPECASLPNAITLLPPKAKGHHHSLFLTYHLHLHPDSAGSSRQANNFICGICGGVVRSAGVYFCRKCHYYAHIKCATSDPSSFKPVLIRDAKFAGLLHFPLANECTNLMRYITARSSSSDEAVDSRDDDTQYHPSDHLKLLQQTLHQHPLIFHDEDDHTIDDNDAQYSTRVCNACVQTISPPFYSCSHCPDFLLHSFCANLPSKIDHPMHPNHPLFLYPKAPKPDIPGFYVCHGCELICNGFAYSCNTCPYFNMDVVCALLPPSITYETHNKAHMIYMNRRRSYLGGLVCSSCNHFMSGIHYQCSTCPNFVLHATCALFPNTVRHKFDEHPLTLTTTSKNISGKNICEICEREIFQTSWHYSCSQCEQSFHCKCIPSLDCLSKIKLGVSIRVDGHSCPLKLILESMVFGYRCGFCRDVFRDDNSGITKPAYECSNCYYRIHYRCAQKCLLLHN